MKPRYTFSHRAGGRLHWTRPAPEVGGRGLEEVVSCSALWFWGQLSQDASLPRCDCELASRWGATGVMPPGHVLVVAEGHSYLAHREAP